MRLTDEQREALYEGLAWTVGFLNGVVTAVIPGETGSKASRAISKDELVALVVTIPMVRVLEDLQNAGLLGTCPPVGDIVNEEIVYRAMRDRTGPNRATYLGVLRAGFVLGSTILADVARPLDEERMDDHMAKHLKLLRKLNPPEGDEH